MTTTPTKEVTELSNEVRLLYQTMVQFGEALHSGNKISMGMRAVLEYLDREGGATVPHIARSRHVTRQRIQTLVNSLLTLDLVAHKDNPGSKRSPLIEISKAGRSMITEMKVREAEHLSVGVSGRKLAEATRTLRAIRLSLEIESG
jgi:DNA-binding MarR family transcriptional regulator